MNLVLDKEVDQGYQSSEKGAAKDLPVVDCSWVVRTQRETSDGPWKSSDKVGNHEDVMPVVVVGRSDIGPASASEGSEDAHTSDELGKTGVGSCGQDIPQGN